VCVVVAVACVLLRDATGIMALNPVVIALLAGIAIGAATGRPALLRPGIAFTAKPLLRAAIILLGLQVTLGELAGLGAAALLLAVAVVGLTVPFTIWLGGRMGVSPALAQLIGVGTGICGASAIVAANQVARGRDEDVAYALAVITLCGTASLLLFPLFGAMLGMSDHAYGLWAGAAIHEVVQAVGAAAAAGAGAVQSGTVMKLARVVLLAPAILALGWFLARGTGKASAAAPVPWFAFGFLALVLARSTGIVPAVMVEASRYLVPLMLAASVAALGVSTDLRIVRRYGARPLLLGAASTVFITMLAVVGVVAVT
jgi:uncharacterized integral membrane protein (TIGR00698 family)